MMNPESFVPGPNMHIRSALNHRVTARFISCQRLSNCTYHRQSTVASSVQVSEQTQSPRPVTPLLKPVGRSHNAPPARCRVSLQLLTDNKQCTHGCFTSASTLRVQHAKKGTLAPLAPVPRTWVPLFSALHLGALTGTRKSSTDACLHFPSQLRSTLSSMGLNGIGLF